VIIISEIFFSFYFTETSIFLEGTNPDTTTDAHFCQVKKKEFEL